MLNSRYPFLPILLLVFQIKQISAFTTSSAPSLSSSSITTTASTPRTITTPIKTELFATTDENDNGDNDNDDNEETSPSPITREAFQRDVLQDPKTHRRKKGNRYRVLDNRDALPFVVKVVTPDPYKKKAEAKKEAERNTRAAQKKKAATTAARLFRKDEDGSLNRILGEFTLDKSTNCGDVIEVGEVLYEVQKARCQYKYAGGKRFVMVRKILEVKDVTRVAQERYLMEQLKLGE